MSAISRIQRQITSLSLLTIWRSRFSLISTTISKVTSHYFKCLWLTLFFRPFYMRTACVWCILLDLSVVFFFFCFLYINFCSDSFDIFGTFFTSVKFFASCTPVFYLFDTRFPLLCYQNDRKCQKCQLCHVIFYPSFFFFERSIQKLSVSCF